MRKGGRGDVSHRSIEVCSGFYKKHGQTSIELELGLKFLVSSTVFSVQLFGSNFPYFTWIFLLFQKEQRFSKQKKTEKPEANSDFSVRKIDGYGLAIPVHFLSLVLLVKVNIFRFIADRFFHFFKFLFKRF